MILSLNKTYPIDEALESLSDSGEVYDQVDYEADK